jgi:hypothetical protein
MGRFTPIKKFAVTKKPHPPNWQVRLFFATHPD